MTYQAIIEPTVTITRKHVMLVEEIKMLIAMNQETNFITT